MKSMGFFLSAGVSLLLEDDSERDFYCSLIVIQRVCPAEPCEERAPETLSGCLLISLLANDFSEQRGSEAWQASGDYRSD